MVHATKQPTPRENRRRATFKRIIEAAMATVVKVGFGGLSMNQLARELDYTPGALYRYFRCKDELLSRLIERVIADIGARLSDSVANTTPPIRRLFLLASTYHDIAVDDPNRFGLIAMLMAEPRLVLTKPETVAPAMDAVLMAFKPAMTALVELSARGVLSPGDPTERVVVLFAALHGAVQLHKQEVRLPGVIDSRKLTFELLKTLLKGWGAPESSFAEGE